MLNQGCALAVACVLLAAACSERAAPTSPSSTPAPPQSPAPDPVPPPAPDPPAPGVTFGAGEHRVGTEIPAGVYYTDPVSGCYWERQSESTGTSAGATAFAFVGYDASQWIVEILASDHAFDTNAECGTWFSSARRGSQASIEPGVWAVGAQVSPGLYRTSASAGCYWERLRHFTGHPDGTIASALTPAGTQFVTVEGGDAGFRSNGACGTWTPVQSDTGRSPASSGTLGVPGRHSGAQPYWLLLKGTPIAAI